MPQILLASHTGSDGRVCLGDGGQQMDPRQENGRLLAQDVRTKHIEGATWFVPSQSGGSGYLVNLSAATCTCHSFELRRDKCKHQWAAEFKRSAGEHPQLVLGTVKIPRKTYPQPNWPAYTAAQCDEKRLVQKLLRGLCDGIISPPHPGRGPKPIPLSDAVYGMVMKVYVGMSGRRATSDIKACADLGHLSRMPRFNTLFDYFDKPEMTRLLTVLIEESATPLACVESQFAADSTGFGTSVNRRWYEAKYGREMREHTWLKAHSMVGTKTNVVTAVTITEGSAHDSPEFPALVSSTARRFTIQDVSADRAYLSHKNLKTVEAVGAVPYIPFKINCQAEGPAAWRRMWAVFMYRQAEFLQHYHRRSNAESTFSAVKRKFGSSLRSKNFVAQTNELLAKLLCWNLSCLVHAIYELGIKPEFDFINVEEMAA